MWIYLNNSFLSIVAKNDNPGLLHVRARREGDIEALFPAERVTATSHRDYAFRADIERTQVELAIRNEVSSIDYTNFKGSVDDGDRHDEYLRVWSVMVDEQMKRQ